MPQYNHLQSTIFSFLKILHSSHTKKTNADKKYSIFTNKALIPLLVSSSSDLWENHLNSPYIHVIFRAAFMLLEILNCKKNKNSKL